MTWLDKEKLLEWIEAEAKISANGYQVGYQTALKFMEYQLLMGKFDAPEANELHEERDTWRSKAFAAATTCREMADIVERFEEQANQLREENAKLVKALEHIAYEVSHYVGEEVEVARKVLSELRGREHQ